MALMSKFLSTETNSVQENQERDIWDSFLKTNSLGNLWQTIDYGEFIKRLYSHAQTVRLIFVQDGVAEGIVQGLFSKYFGFGTVMNVREGPLLGMASRDRPDVLKALIAALEKFGAKNRIIRIKIERPYNWGNTDLLANMGYEHIGTKNAYTIDLGRGSEGLWKHIYGNKRRNIKKALDRGVEFIETNNFEDVEEFYRLLLDLAKRDKFVPGPLSWFQALWNSRSQEFSSKIFFARWKGNNVSSVFATIHAKTIYALGWGYLSTALEVRPNDLLHWKIMEWGCKQGFLRYHMGDVHPEKDLSGGGTWRWKREWNGDQDPVYIFRKSISKYSLIEKIYDRLKKNQADT
jgi:hypothetical protein